MPCFWSNDLSAVALPFFYTFFDEDNVFTDIHDGVHIMCVDDSRHFVFGGDIVDQIVDNQRSLGVQAGVRFVTEQIFGFKAIARAMAARFIIPPLISDG